MKSTVSAIILSAAMTATATPGLVLDVTGPSSTVNVDALNVKAVLKNTGNETLKLLKDPRTILSKAPTDAFSISSEGGSPEFTGIKLKYVPSQAAAIATTSDFTVLAPGQSIEITHSLAGVYNFTRGGQGAYKFAAKNQFSYVDASGQLKNIEASSNSNGFKLAGKLVAPDTSAPAARLSKRVITYTGCTESEQALIQTAADSANKYVENANTYLSTLPPIAPRYTTWFGIYNTARADTVKSHFSLIGTSATSTNYNCAACKNTPGISYSSTYAFVRTTQFGIVNLCGVFWSAPNEGTDSRAGTIVHENSHFTQFGGTSDYAYGQTRAKALAISSPAQAVQNADSHEYFVENNPQLA